MKPGYKTTEFYVALLTIVGATIAALAGNLSPKYAALAAAISTAAYAIARGLAKTPSPTP